MRSLATVLLCDILAAASPVPVRVSLASATPLSTTEPTYASWNIDSSCNRGFHHINFTNPNLLAAAVGLHPSKLRFGGSGNDNLIYGLSPGSPECRGILPSGNCSQLGYDDPGCLNATHWDALYGLAARSGAQLVFGVAYGKEAACAQGDRYEWQAGNAASLLSYLNRSNQPVWGFELGNEVNNNGPGTSCGQTPEQQARAQLRFGPMVRAAQPHAVLIGPDTGGRNPLAWLESYLPLVNRSGLHAVTHHVYGGIGRTNFNDSRKLDSSLTEIGWYTTVIKKSAHTSQIWAGENGPTGGGPDGTCGKNSACGTYATTLWYADDLGLRAKHGFVQYQRQDLFGGYYGLTNSISRAQALGPSDPVVIRPDYWTNFLWKRTIGPKVLNATSSSTNLRAYAFAGPPPSTHAEPACLSASLQLVLINLQEVQIKLGSLPVNGRYAAWTLGPNQTDIHGPFSQHSLLNGAQLPTVIDVSHQDPQSFLARIPAEAREGSAQSGVALAPLSTTFMCLNHG